MAIKIFFCYAHENEAFLKKLKKHLRPLQREGIIEVWHDRDIKAGAEWEPEVKKQLDEAQIILLLISPDFMDSDYCYGVEMERALERHKLKDALVIPIILLPVYWQIEALRGIQALPSNAIPIIHPDWHTEDEAFFNVAEGIREVVEGFLQTQSTDVEPLQEEPLQEELFSDKIISTGFRDLDFLLHGGLQRTDFVVVAAPPAHGKTSLALSIALNLALKNTLSVCIFTLDMTKKQLVQRLLSIDAAVDQHNLSTGQLEDDEWERVICSMEALSNANIWVYDGTCLDITELQRKAKQLTNECKADLIIIDYVDLMQREEELKQHNNDEQSAINMSRDLKIMTRDLNVPIMALVQRSYRSGSHHSELLQRSSTLNAPIDTFADIVMVPYRDEVYNSYTDRRNLIDIIICKHRRGKVGEITLYFNPYTTRMRDLEMTPPESI
jgi:KaiC/GvpD/RAD55 family RecA-like ATPase